MDLGSGGGSVCGSSISGGVETGLWLSPVGGVIGRRGGSDARRAKRSALVACAAASDIWDVGAEKERVGSPSGEDLTGRAPGRRIPAGAALAGGALAGGGAGGGAGATTAAACSPDRNIDGPRPPTAVAAPPVRWKRGVTAGAVPAVEDGACLASGRRLTTRAATVGPFPKWRRAMTLAATGESGIVGALSKSASPSATTAAACMAMRTGVLVLVVGAIAADALNAPCAPVNASDAAGAGAVDADAAGGGAGEARKDVSAVGGTVGVQLRHVGTWGRGETGRAPPRRPGIGVPPEPPPMPIEAFARSETALGSAWRGAAGALVEATASDDAACVLSTLLGCGPFFGGSSTTSKAVRESPPVFHARRLVAASGGVGGPGPGEASRVVPTLPRRLPPSHVWLSWLSSTRSFLGDALSLLLSPPLLLLLLLSSEKGAVAPPASSMCIGDVVFVACSPAIEPLHEFERDDAAEFVSD